jgi:hypothetical protein
VKAGTKKREVKYALARNPYPKHYFFRATGININTSYLFKEADVYVYKVLNNRPLLSGFKKTRFVTFFLIQKVGLKVISF